MEASNTPDTVFKTMVLRVLKEFRGRMNRISETLNHQKKSQSEMKNIISERKCTLEGINSSLGGAED